MKKTLFTFLATLTALSNALALPATVENPAVDVKSQNVVTCVISESGYTIYTADAATPSTIPFSGTLKIEGANSTTIEVNGMPANTELLLQDISIQKLIVNCDAPIKVRGENTITAAPDDVCIEQGGTSAMVTIAGPGSITLNGSDCTKEMPIVKCISGITFSNTGSVSIVAKCSHCVPVKSPNAIFVGNNSVNISASMCSTPIFYFPTGSDNTVTFKNIKGDIVLHGGTSPITSNVDKLDINGDGGLVLEMEDYVPCVIADYVDINVKGDITANIKSILFYVGYNTNLTAKNINITKVSSDGSPLFSKAVKIAATGDVVIDGGGDMIISDGPFEASAKSMSVKTTSTGAPMFYTYNSTMKFVTTGDLSFEAPSGAQVLNCEYSQIDIECGNLKISGNTNGKNSLITGATLDIKALDVAIENKGNSAVASCINGIRIGADNLSVKGNGSVDPILNSNKTISAEVTGDLLIDNAGGCQCLFSQEDIYLKGNNITINSNSNPSSFIGAKSTTIDANNKLTINSGHGFFDGPVDAKCKDFKMVSSTSAPIFTNLTTFALSGGDFTLEQTGYMIASAPFTLTGANNVSIATKSNTPTPVFGSPAKIECSGDIEITDDCSVSTALLSSPSTIKAGKGITISTNGRLSYCNGHDITGADDIDITVGVGDSNPSGAYGLSNITSTNGTVTYSASTSTTGHKIFTQSPLSESTPLPKYFCYITWPNGATTFFEARNDAMSVFGSSSAALIYLPVDPEDPEYIYTYTDEYGKEVKEIVPNIVDITDPDNYVCQLLEIRSGQVPFIKEGFTAVDAVSIAAKRGESEWSSAYLPFMPDDIDEGMTTYHIGSANEKEGVVYIEENDAISANSIVVLQPVDEGYIFKGENVEVVPTNITSASVTGAKMIANGSEVVVGKDLSTDIKDVNAENAAKTIKTIENGKVVIIKNGEKFDLSGRKVE